MVQFTSNNTDVYSSNKCISAINNANVYAIIFFLRFLVDQIFIVNRVSQNIISFAIFIISFKFDLFKIIQSCIHVQIEFYIWLILCDVRSRCSYKRSFISFITLWQICYSPNNAKSAKSIFWKDAKCSPLLAIAWIMWLAKTKAFKVRLNFM